MQRPGCDDSFITVLASAVGGQATAAGIAGVLETYPGSDYLRTDQTCPSLTPEIDGAPIYVVFFGPFVVASDACAARAQGSEGAYVRQLSDDLGPRHGISCA
jgi:serine/threonine-protein kinase